MSVCFSFTKSLNYICQRLVFFIFSFCEGLFFRGEKKNLTELNLRRSSLRRRCVSVPNCWHRSVLDPVYTDRRTPEEGRRLQQPKYKDRNNKDEDIHLNVNETNSRNSDSCIFHSIFQ